jgi:asparagine synthase (glutamine-hydrolysing)
MVERQRHRGPDATGTHVDPSGPALLGHNRLSIIDLSEAGRQPMSSADGQLHVVFNGEIYNHVELRAELGGYPFRSRTDTEVLLAAYAKWGAACLDRLIGMFSFLIWDARERRLFAARDRFGVKPLYYSTPGVGRLAIASEIPTLHAAGLGLEPNESAWATYLTHGVLDHSPETFWREVRSLPPGHVMTWTPGAEPRIAVWYDLAERVGPELDRRSEETVMEEYVALLRESVRLRFRSDVPVGVNISGGVDSSTLAALVRDLHGADAHVDAFTFATGDPAYDETPWVEEILARTGHRSILCRLRPDDVPALAESVHGHVAEPIGGLPTLAYARVFEEARARGVIVLLDGQGMDEQWAGYDYYRKALNGGTAGVVQGSSDRPVRPECLVPEFRALAAPFHAPTPLPDPLRNLQYRDARFTKIPRALRYNDRISMRASTELREPFLDHRLFELALRQPVDRKIHGEQGKWLLRRMLHTLLPEGVVEAPKRPLQTPQREWLRGPLREWAGERIERALDRFGGDWLDAEAVRSEWGRYVAGEGDNSMFVWQWVSAGTLAPEPSLVDAPPCL